MWLRERPSHCLFPLLLAAALSPPAAHADRDGYVLGVFPFLASVHLEEIFAPLAARLAAETRAPIAFRSAADFDRFERAIQEARFDFAFVQPFDYVRFAAPAGYRPLARIAEPLVAVFSVRSDSAAASLSDLRGQRLGLPPPQAAVSILARDALLAAGLVPARDLQVEHMLTHDACLQALLSRSVDACVTADFALQYLEAGMEISLRRLAVTPSLPGPLFVAHERAPAALVAAVRTHLLDPAFTAEVIPFFRNGLVPTTDAEYQPVRAAWRRIQEDSSGPLVKLVLGAHPFLPIPRLEEVFGPLVEMLAREAGIPVQLRTASSMDRFIANLELGRYDLAVLQGTDYVSVAERIGFVPMVKNTLGIRAVFLVKPESPLIRLADLRGMSVATPPYLSATERLARCELLSVGLHPGRDVERVEVSGHDACLAALAADRVAACATTVTAAEWLGYAGAFRPIGTSAQISTPLIAAHPRVPEALRNKLTAAMLRPFAAGEPPNGGYIVPIAAASPEDFATERLIVSGECWAGAAPAAGAQDD